MNSLVAWLIVLTATFGLMSGLAAWRRDRAITRHRKFLMETILESLEQQVAFMSRLYEMIPGLNEDSYNKSWGEIHRRIAEIRRQTSAPREDGHSPR